MHITAMGMQEWARIVIGGKSHKDASQCWECQTEEVPTWKGYCAECWYKHEADKEGLRKDEDEAMMAMCSAPRQYAKTTMEEDDASAIDMVTDTQVCD